MLEVFHVEFIAFMQALQRAAGMGVGDLLLETDVVMVKHAATMVKL